MVVVVIIIIIVVMVVAIDCGCCSIASTPPESLLNPHKMFFKKLFLSEVRRRVHAQWLLTCAGIDANPAGCLWFACH